MRQQPWKSVRIFLLLAALLPWPVQAQVSPAAAALHTRHAVLTPFLADSPFKGPIHLESAEGATRLQGDLHAVLEHPFTRVSAALADPGHWCDVMMLHLNTKQCLRTAAGGATTLELRVGRKYDQPLAAASRVAFSFHAASVTAEFLALDLRAPDGPFDTRDYRIVLEAVPLPNGRTFLHMGYSFSYGTVSRMAMTMYLATAARDKVGFSAAPDTPRGEPVQYIRGMRALVERNTMRYYLAIDAYLGALDAPPAQRQDKRLRDWFDATEKYARQLHEIDREAYLLMKGRESLRQAVPGRTASE